MTLPEGDVLDAFRSHPTRGFLFADLRAYTAFAETRGDAAAAELLETYRGLVREAVRTFGGAEIKTEGDSFYVVFPGASDAVRCGLAIVIAAEAATARQPDRPLRVGVGVHAGESAETSEGYVGTAVNTAARVCSVAKAGELLVTDIVRGLTRTSLPYGFVSVGARRLKGIAEPVPLYRVEADRAAQSKRWFVLPIPRRPGRAPTPFLAGLVVLALAATGLVGAVALNAAHGSLGTIASPPGATPSPSEGELAAATPTPTSTTDLFPNETERTLLAPMPASLARSCERGSYAVVVNMTPISSIRCAENVATGINELVILRFRPQSSGAGSEPDAYSTDDLVARLSGTTLNSGDCATSSTGLGQWKIGERVAGAFACFVDGATGDAILYWSSTDRQILAKAVNQHGDSAALYKWFSDSARFITP